MRVADTDILPRNFTLRQTAERNAGRLIPRDVMLEVTYRCNLGCIHCGLEPYINERQSTELTFSEITGVLDQLFKAGVLGVSFTGGEPLCRPDLFDIIRYASKIGLFFGLKTNGTMLTEAMAEDLKKLGITAVHVSLYGATPETHEYVTGVAGSFKKSVHAVEILKSNKIRVAFKAMIMKCNIKEDNDMAALAERMGVRYSADPTIFPKFGRPGSADSIRIDDEQLQQLIKQRNWINSETSIFTDDSNRHILCSGGRVRCAISPQGEVYPCPLWRIPLGNLREQTFQDIWHGEAADRVRAITATDFPVCVECNLMKYCARCPGMVFMENSDISGPSPESCRLARAVKGVIENGNQKSLPKS